MKKIIITTCIIFLSILCFSQNELSLKEGSKELLIRTEVTTSIQGISSIKTIAVIHKGFEGCGDISKLTIFLDNGEIVSLKTVEAFNCDDFATFHIKSKYRKALAAHKISKITFVSASGASVTVKPIDTSFFIKAFKKLTK